MRPTAKHGLVQVALLGLLLALGCDAAPPKPAPSPVSPASTAPADATASVPVPAVGSSTDTAPSAAVSSDAVARLVKGSNAFGFDLWKKLPGPATNQIISPASLTTALAMTWGGAKAETAAEMGAVLRLEGSPAEVMRASAEMVRSLTDPSRGVVFRVANRLFGEQSYRFEQPYLDATRSAYGAALEAVDFAKAPEPTRVRINAWVEQQTEKRVKNLVPPGAIDSQTRLALVNAIYFLGDWAEAFRKEDTRPEPFFLAKDRKVDVPTMMRRGEMLYAEQPGLQAVELPYKGKSMSMLLLVPTDPTGLPAVERSLDAAKLAAIVSALHSETVALWLPKFEIAPADSLELGDPLQALGMKSAFRRGAADFTAIANPPDPGERFFIGQVFHKGFVRVDERGTEAAAATAVVMGPGGKAPGEPRQLRADRPFLFFVRDRLTGLVVFQGRLADPRAR